MGSSAPAKETRYNASRPAALHAGGPVSMAFMRDVASAPTPTQTGCIIAPSGKVDAELDHVDGGGVELLGLDDPDENMPVWV